LLVLTSSSVMAGPTPKVRRVNFIVEHQPDGGKRPNQVKESYSISDAGVLRYSAYFGGMPIDMNHMDSLEWKAGAAGRRVIETTQRLLRDKVPGLAEIFGDMAIPRNGVGLYVVVLDGGEHYIQDRGSRAWAEMDAPFQAMVAAFEKETQRPRRPEQLPQTPRATTATIPTVGMAATSAANAALDRAYAKFAQRPGAVAPPHKGEWVTEAQATVTFDKQRGHTYTWGLHRPAGFECDAVVAVDLKGVVRVVRADAVFSPD
jgi:hypothetical protein